MKEKVVIKWGFERTDVSAEESGDKAYHYYSFDFFDKFNGVSLLSCSNDETKNGKWFVTLLEENRIRFTKKKDLIKFIDLITKCSIKYVI
jgi:hypothetical protein